MIPKAIPLDDLAAFLLAMRHRSAASNPVTESYERLEFFGDSILGMVIAEYLYSHHPEWDQGMLSKAKSSIVQEGPLAEAAMRLGLDRYVELSVSEETTGGRQRPSILADVFEALLGAIYLESGLELVRWFILEQLQANIETISTGDVNPNDYKSKLQEIAQATWHKTPTYRLIRENGIAHERRFSVQVLFDDEVMGEGVGRSKKEAEQSAAQDALQLILSAKQAREIVLDRFDLD
jgi:ribonuclease-3